MKKNIIIAGVHKGGSTSLFQYLMNHPSVCASSKKEIHFFTPLRYNQKIGSIDHYYKFFNHCKSSSKYLLEASPSYMYGLEKISSSIFSNFQNPKIIFVLRNPVERFISYYYHCEGKFYIKRNTSFIDFYNENLKNYDKPEKDSPYFRGLREGMYYRYLNHWLENYKENIKVVFFENLIGDPNKEMRLLCEWLQIKSSYYTNYNFDNHNKTFRFRNKNLQIISKFIARNFEHFLRNNLFLKQSLKKIRNNFNTIPKVAIQEKEKRLVIDFYEKENTKLRKLLSNQKNLPKWLTDQTSL